MSKFIMQFMLLGETFIKLIKNGVIWASQKHSNYKKKKKWIVLETKLNVFDLIVYKRLQKKTFKMLFIDWINIPFWIGGNLAI